MFLFNLNILLWGHLQWLSSSHPIMYHPNCNRGWKRPNISHERWEDANDDESVAHFFLQSFATSLSIHCSCFPGGGSNRTEEKVEPIFEQFQEKLRSVTKMATDVLASLHQERLLDFFNLPCWHCKWIMSIGTKLRKRVCPLLSKHSWLGRKRPPDNKLLVSVSSTRKFGNPHVQKKNPIDLGNFLMPFLHIFQAVAMVSCRKRHFPPWTRQWTQSTPQLPLGSWRCRI